MNRRVLLSLAILLMTPAVAAAPRFSDLLLQIQRLQQEVQRLHGRIELLQHRLFTLERRQQEHYLDLDVRLSGQAAATAPVRGTPDPMGTVGRSSSPPTAVATPPPGEQETYRNAFDLLKQRRYEEAVRGFQDLLMRYPHSEFAGNACYWLGEVSYVEHDYADALTQLRRVAADYPLSPKVPASLLKIGYIHYEQNDWQPARKVLQDILDRFPDTTEAHLAASRLERMTREGH